MVRGWRDFVLADHLSHYGNRKGQAGNPVANDPDRITGRAGDFGPKRAARQSEAERLKTEVRRAEFSGRLGRFYGRGCGGRRICGGGLAEEISDSHGYVLNYTKRGKLSSR